MNLSNIVPQPCKESKRITIRNDDTNSGKTTTYSFKCKYNLFLIWLCMMNFLISKIPNCQLLEYLMKANAFVFRCAQRTKCNFEIKLDLD